MQPLVKDQTTLEENCARSWKEFFGTNLNALFQLALLLSADPEMAEASLARAIDEIDPSQFPREQELAIVQAKICKQSIRSKTARADRKNMKACILLQRRLCPVLELESSPRVCFVLRILLGCGISSCAQMLGIEGNGVRGLLRMAVLQLQRAVTSDNAAFVATESEAAPEEVVPFRLAGFLSVGQNEAPFQ